MVSAVDDHEDVKGKDPEHRTTRHEHRRPGPVHSGQANPPVQYSGQFNLLLGPVIGRYNAWARRKGAKPARAHENQADPWRIQLGFPSQVMGACYLLRPTLQLARDCTSLPRVADVACLSGKCIIYRCLPAAYVVGKGIVEALRASTFGYLAQQSSHNLTTNAAESSPQETSGTAIGSGIDIMSEVGSGPRH